MKFTLIHLSDIHFHLSSNPFLNNKEKFLDAIQNSTIGVDQVFILFSGDIANTGDEKEYEIAITFIAEIKARIQKISGNTPICISVAGNHDCILPEIPSKSRENQIKTIESNGDSVIDSEVFEICLKPQKNYKIFQNDLKLNTYLKHSTEIFNLYEFIVSGKKIHFYCYNTAYMSILKEQKHVGKMYFPFEMIAGNYFTQPADLKLSVFHHPYNWLSINNLRGFRGHIERTSDMAFTGHEHEYTKSLKNDLDGNFNYLFEGDVLQGKVDSKDVSGFNLFQFDLEKNIFFINNYKFNGDIYKPKTTIEKWEPIERGILKVSKIFEINKSFQDKLNDLGANFIHPVKKQLNLQDIYIYPFLKAVDILEEKNQGNISDVLSSELIVEKFKKDFKISFVGAENCGKSALAKVIFKKLRCNDFIPILVDGHEIKKTSLDDFKKILIGKFNEQYSPNELDQFLQLNHEKIAIIIDDFDETKLSPKYNAIFLVDLCKEYNNIITFSTEILEHEEILKEEKEIKDFPKFNLYEILEFGHVLRGKLINRWNCLGIEEQITDEVRVKKNSDTEEKLNRIIGKNFVPHYPVFILTILQAIDDGATSELQASAYGHYYHFLITKSLQRVIKKADAGAYFSYLGELAFELHSKKTKNLIESQFKEFHERFKKDYALPKKKSLNEFRENLLKASILVDFSDSYEFKYEYIYYFFLGQFLAANMPDEKIQVEIKELCSKLYRRENANIIMFLTHHTKDSFLLDELVSNAKKIFSEFLPVELQGDITTINELYNKIDTLVIKKINVDSHREEEQKKQDVIERKEKVNQNFRDEDVDDMVKLSGGAKINLALKTIEILGQILRNNYASIKADKKLLLAEEAYFTGLRTLSFFFTNLEKSAPFIVNGIIETINLKKEDDVRKIKELSQKIFFHFCGFLCYHFIRKISGSISSENLSETFESIEKKHDYNSIKLINFSNELDQYSKFPVSTMKSLKKLLHRNPLCFATMSRLIEKRLYMFPSTTTEKQIIFSEMGFTMESQRLIEATSKERR